MKGFPLQNLLPGLLVILIVDSDDVIHISLTNVVVLPFPPRQGHWGELDKHDPSRHKVNPHIHFTESPKITCTQLKEPESDTFSVRTINFF